MRYFTFLLVFVVCGSKIFGQTAVNFSIDLKAARTAISPYIYGINFDNTAVNNYTAFRLGGNRMTGYNWENNYSNAGSDYLQSSDTYLCNNASVCSQPGRVYTDFYNNAKSTNGYTLATLPMAGYVSADKNGTVGVNEAAPSTRWKEIKFAKGSAFSLTPDLSDPYVYIDESVNFLVKTYGTATKGGVRAYDLDNEPSLWSSTHPRIHPVKLTCKELVDRSTALAKAVKNVDPTAEIFGMVSYGFGENYDLQSATDWPSLKGSYSWYPDYFLDNMKKNEDGRRRLDVMDVHWYPEASGDHRITDDGATTAKDNDTRMQAPRTLWDPSYTENSWIGQYYKSSLPFLSHLQKSITNYYPGTKLSFSEYFYGGSSNVSGGIAQADVLGIFGKYGIYSGFLWGTADQYISSGYQIYTNYDGKSHRFGSTGISATTDNVQGSSVYASIEGTNEDSLHLMVINKSNLSMPCNFAVNSAGVYKSAQLWGFNSASTSLASTGRAVFAWNWFTGSAAATCPANGRASVQMISFRGCVGAGAQRRGLRSSANTRNTVSGVGVINSSWGIP